MVSSRFGFWALRAAATIAAACLASPVVAQPVVAPADGAIEKLKPGEFLWAPHIAPRGPVTVIISLKAQRAFAYRNGVPIGVSTVSTGKPGYETPIGVFTILQKKIDHKSNLYDDAPMPYMQRLTWTGVALHAGNLPGYPASHGCVRLPRKFALLLFAITKLGFTVIITDDPVVPEFAAAPTLLGPSEKDTPSDQNYRWQPEKSLAGPLSIILSGRDRRIVVLRNGVEIGSSQVSIDVPVTETVAFTLTSADAGKFDWLRLALPGQLSTLPTNLTVAERARVIIPDDFRQRLAEALVPGTTLLVTRASIRSGGTGKQIVVLATQD